jgi:hypothetical protein
MSWVSYLCKKLQNNKTVANFLWWLPVDTIIRLFHIKMSVLRIFSNGPPLSYLIILILNRAFDDM